MNIAKMIENYEDLKYEYDEAEKKASIYKREYDEMTDIGYSEEDAYTHSMASSWSSYQDEVDQMQKELEQCDISNNKAVARQLIKDFNKIEINTLIEELHRWFATYGGDTYKTFFIYTQPLFIHDEWMYFLDDIIADNCLNEYNWSIDKNEYLIVVDDESKTIKSYNQKEFFEWLEEILSIIDWWDLEITEHLEAIAQIVDPKYYR